MDRDEGYEGSFEKQTYQALAFTRFKAIVHGQQQQFSRVNDFLLCHAN